jgi:hypothetical protein
MCRCVGLSVCVCPVLVAASVERLVLPGICLAAAACPLQAE